MSQPIVGTIPADLQGQSVNSSLVTVFEVEVPNSDIGGAGIDKLYFHDGVTADLTTDDGVVKWYTLLDDNNFGSTTPGHYGEQFYTPFPVESEGWDVRGSGSLPRPTVRFANINQFPFPVELMKHNDFKIFFRNIEYRFCDNSVIKKNPSGPDIVF